MVQQSSNCTLAHTVTHSLHFKDTSIVLMLGLLLGAYWSVSSNLTVE